MAKLIYSAITSLDGFVADKQGNFDWAAPDEEVHAFVNEIERPIGTYLYGRAMFDVMAVWETMATADEPPCIQDYAEIWKAADKVVYSRTLASAPTAKTRIERSFEPESVRAMKAATVHDISVGGPHLAAEAIATGLVDECHLFLTPVVVGGGNPSLPANVHVKLELLDVNRFGGGVIHLHYRFAY